MFAIPSTPAQQTRSANYSSQTKAYNTRTPHTPTSLSVSSSETFVQQSQSYHTQQASTPPQATTRSSLSPFQTPFVDSSSSSEHQRTSPPPSLDRNLHTSPMQPPYPNTPSPQPSFGINGTIIVNEPTSIMQSHPISSDCGASDVFISQALPKSQTQNRPALRPSLSHNALLNTPSPSSWPRRIMTTGSTLSAAAAASVTGQLRQSTMPAPSITYSGSSALPENNGNAIVHSHHHQQPHHQHQHEVNTPFLSHSTSSTASNASSTTATHPHPHPHPSYPSYTSSYHHQHPHEDPPYPNSTYEGYSSSSSPWPMTTIISHPHHQQQQQQQQQQQSPYHWGMHHMAIPSKQDEPVLAPGELPAPRPPMSYAALIGEALLLAPPPHQLYVSEISDSIKKRYPYYRQNPTKIYNGVRHQTSMCKAFVKLPRPFGDQSGGARKWAIRAGCEGWFAGGGYHPPSSTASPPSSKMKNGGKAKATARSKHLIIGTSEEKKATDAFPSSYPSSGSGGEGPSSGPAYDGSYRSLMPYSQSCPSNSFAAPAPPPPNGHLPPGYHYVPIPPAHGHPQPTQPIYVPVWGPYASQHPTSSYQNQSQGHPGHYQQQQYHPGSESPEMGTWRGMGGVETQSNDGTHVSSSYEEVKMMPRLESPTASVHSMRGSAHSSHGASPETM